MSVKRYDFGPVQPEHHERPDGDWVHASDYLELESHINRVNRSRDGWVKNFEALQAESMRVIEDRKMLQAKVKEHEDTINNLRDYISEQPTVND